jgi:hypothetical protein
VTAATATSVGGGPFGFSDDDSSSFPWADAGTVNRSASMTARTQNLLMSSFL